MQIEYSGFKDRFLKIAGKIKRLETWNRLAKDDIFSIFSRNQWVKIQFEDYSLYDCSQCLNFDEVKKVLPGFLIKMFTLKKARKTWLYKDTVSKIVTILDCNAAFDVSFSKCACINKKDRSNRENWQRQLTPVS